MELDNILKKIQKKQKLLLYALASGSVESDQECRLNKIAAGLRLMGLVVDDEICLSEKGKEFVGTFRDELFRDVSIERETILHKLRQKGVTRVPSGPRITKAAKLFLALIFECPVNAIHVRGVKNLLPLLENEGYVNVSANLSITDLGRERVGGYVSAELKEEARKRFFTTSKAEGRSKILERAERFLTLYRNGFTYQEIGDLHGLTRERVRQVLNKTDNFAAYLLEHEEAERERDRAKEKEARFKQLEKSLANQFPDRVDELWDRERNLGLDPTNISSRSASFEIWWKCPIDGHSWKKRPAEIALSWLRSNTSGCPKCAGKTRKPTKQTTLTDKFPELVKKYWFFEKNQAEGLDPEKLTLASNQKAWFRCPKDMNMWLARIHSTVRQQWMRGNAGCRVCNGTIQRKSGTWKKAPKLEEAFPLQVSLYWDFIKNNEIGISPSVVTTGSSKESWFKCPIDGESWRAKIAAIRQSWIRDKSGCPKCHGRLSGKGALLTNQYSELIVEVWDFIENDNEGLKYEGLTTGSNRLASFLCSRDGTKWREPIKDVVKYWEKGKNGCPTCNKGRRIIHKIS